MNFEWKLLSLNGGIFIIYILSINPFVFTLHTYHFSKMIWPSCLSNVMQLFLDTRQYIDISFHFLIWSDAYAVQSNFACRIYGWFDPPWEIWLNLFFLNSSKLSIGHWTAKSKVHLLSDIGLSIPIRITAIQQSCH